MRQISRCLLAVYSEYEYENRRGIASGVIITERVRKALLLGDSVDGSNQQPILSLSFWQMLVG